MKLYQVMFPFNATISIKGVNHTYGYQTTDRRQARWAVRKLRKYGFKDVKFTSK